MMFKKLLNKLCGKYKRWQDRLPSEEEIYSTCYYYRHDYGLLDPKQQEEIWITANEMFLAWKKTFNKCNKK